MNFVNIGKGQVIDYKKIVSNLRQKGYDTFSNRNRLYQIRINPAKRGFNTNGKLLSAEPCFDELIEVFSIINNELDKQKVNCKVYLNEIVIREFKGRNDNFEYLKSTINVWKKAA